MQFSISRRAFGVSLAGALGWPTLARAQGKPPNILFLMADDVRGDALGCMGHPVVKTPVIDGLARTGVALTECFSPAAGGNAARVSALSGRYPHTHGVKDDESPLADDGILLPRVLAAKGYRTGMVGNFELPGRKMAELFDSAWTFSEDYRAFLREAAPELADDPDALARPPAGQGQPPWDVGPSRLDALNHPIGWTAGKAIEFVEADKEGRSPWFLFANFRKRKGAYVAPLPWTERYPASQFPDPRLPTERPTPRTREDREADYILKSQEAALVGVQQAYMGEVSFLDEQVSRIVRRLRALGQLQNTLIVFTAGQGDMLGALGRMGGGTPYDGATRVPCVLHYEAGFRLTGGVSRVADTTCLAPTILELAGIERPPGFESPSAKEILTVVGADWDEVAFHDAGFHSVRTATWKLVEPREHPTWEPQLFDLEKDPGETTNLYGKPEGAQAQSALSERLKTWEKA